jgi:hypothetical protein
MEQTTAQQMDEAAANAAKEFSVAWSAQEVATWMKAGYKRLSRILMNAFGK